MKAPKDKKVLLIGWDAADWDIIHPLVVSGRMPNLEKIIRNGGTGTIETLEPALSPMLWTTIATGKMPDQHGITGFVEPSPDASSVRPVSVTSRSCKAIWNILNQNEIRTNVIGWWPSHPAEPVDGIYISNLFTKSESSLPGMVHPAALSEEMMKLRLRQQDILIGDLLRFVPAAAGIDQEKDKHLMNLAALLASCNSIFNVAKAALQKECIGLTAVYFDTIDQVSHTFMKFRAPQIEGVPTEYFNLYHHVVDEIYIYHDQMLGELSALAGEDSEIILLSDHGFHSGALRPLNLPNDPAAPALEHSHFGIVCTYGPSFKRSLIKGATLTDITPLLLTLLGLPGGEDMNGDPSVFGVTALPRISSWEQVDGRSGMHQPEMRYNSWSSAEAMMQMMELGYIANPGTDKTAAVRKVVEESKYNLARSLCSCGKYAEAESLLSMIWDDAVPVYRYGLKYAAVLQYQGKLAAANDLLAVIKQKCAREIREASLIDAISLSLAGSHLKALELLNTLCKKYSHLPELYFLTGNELVLNQNLQEAEKYFFKALQIDPRHSPSLINLCEVIRMQGKESPELTHRRDLLTKKRFESFMNTVDRLNELDLSESRVLDFRRYQLVIRLFLEQFHRGAELIR